MGKRLTRDEFINKAKEVHGNKYDYSETVYVNSKTKIRILCPTHGIFEQAAVEHSRGKGCLKCAKEKSRLTHEEFVTRANIVHNSFYNYNKVNFKVTTDKVIIICPIHGEFLQNVNIHLRGSICPKCSIDSKKLTLSEFVDKSEAIHGKFYDYSKVVYINNATKVTITCPVHGDFDMIPNNHMQGSRCKFCNYDNYRMTIDEFIKKAREIHASRYDYSESVYGNNGKEPLKIICKQHGEFFQTPNEHLTGSGCPKCRLKSQNKLYDKLVKDIDCEILFEYSPDFLERQRFDIYFPEYNIAVEYNGEQHYFPKDFFGGQSGFENILERDERKRNKCKENNCHLFELKYDYNENDYAELVGKITLIIKNKTNES